MCILVGAGLFPVRLRRINKLEKEIRLNQEMIADVEKKLKIEYKRASYKDEVIRKITHLKRQKEIAESYIDYHTEMLSVIEKTDKEIREVFD